MLNERSFKQGYLKAAEQATGKATWFNYCQAKPESSHPEPAGVATYNKF